MSSNAKIRMQDMLMDIFTDDVVDIVCAIIKAEDELAANISAVVNELNKICDDYVNKV